MIRFECDYTDGCAPEVLKALTETNSLNTVGYGNDEKYWKDIVSALRTIDYDYVMSIEHEDSLLSPKEGLRKAISVLNNAITFEGKTEMWWA